MEILQLVTPTNPNSEGEWGAAGISRLKIECEQD
jgi:hypothetical protein